MTKDETMAILSMLSEMYRAKTTDAETTVNAWHIFLGEYDYPTVAVAVYEYIKNDTRDYASFPAVGVIIAEIKKERGRRNMIFNAAFAGKSYDELDDELKKRCPMPVYDRMLELGADEMLKQRDVIIEALTPRQHPALTLKGA